MTKGASDTQNQTRWMGMQSQEGRSSSGWSNRGRLINRLLSFARKLNLHITPCWNGSTDISVGLKKYW